MGVLIDPSIPTTDSSGAWKPLIEALAHVAAHVAGDASSGIGAGVGKAFEAVKKFRQTNPSRGQLAWRLWCESLGPTIGMFFQTAGLARRPGDAEIRRLIGHLLFASKERLGESEVYLTKEHLLNLRCDFPLYQRMRETLPVWVRHIDPEHDRDVEDLQRRLDRAFEHGFYEARFDGDAYFNELHEYLCGVGSEAMERWSHWQCYYEFLRREVDEVPVFGQKPGGPSLRDIFVPLRCSWRELPEEECRERDTARKPTCVHLNLLADELQAWLEKSKPKDTLRVVTGGPGCGKSSSAKILAKDVAIAERFHVFFVPLQGLNVSRDIDAIIDDYVRVASRNSNCLPESPVNWVRDQTKPLFLIFDGLDEVARPDGADLEVTRKFLENLRLWLSQMNGAQAPKVLALVLGRPAAAEDAALKIGGLDGRKPPLCGTALRAG